MSTPTVFLVVQPSLSHYREPFVQSLLNLGTANIKLAARYPAFEAKIGKDEVKSASNGLRLKVARLSRRGVVGKFFWDSGLVKPLIKSKSDLVVLEGNFYNLTTWFAAACARVGGKKIAFWGHGWKRAESGTKLFFRKVFYKLAHAHFFYGDNAAEFAHSAGFSQSSIHTVYNSLYTEEFLKTESKKKDKSAGQSRSYVTFIFSGRLTKRHEATQLVRAVLDLRKIHAVDARLIVVGDGSEMEEIQKLATAAPQAIRIMGAEYRGEVLRQLHEESDFAISPGASGLNVIQSLGFGVPVIAADGNLESGPELEAVRDGETGFFFPAGNREQMIEIMLHASLMSTEEKIRMGDTARNLVLARYTSFRHSAAMMSAIMDTVN